MTKIFETIDEPLKIDPTVTEPPFIPEFTVKANCFSQTSPDNPPTGHITFITDDGNITYPEDSKVHSGRSIDATLAVNFIRNFYHNYRVYTVASDHPEYQESVAKEDFHGMKAFADKANDLHKKLFDLTYGMTLERDMILKILSQPKAEGIRFYLCERPINGKLHLSLVAVGVDCEGYDLKYGKENTPLPAVTELSEMALITYSLAAEYLTPPPPNGAADFVEYFYTATPEIDNRYALLKMAKQIKTIAPVEPATPAPTPVDRATEPAAGAK